MLVDFHRISGPHESRHENFEELVSQLLYLEIGAQPVDGRGGDGGVDCFHRADDGRLTVYQAKYFTHRLRSPQRRQVEQSYRRAVSSSAPATWVLCVPMDPTPSERSWLASLGDSQVRTEWLGSVQLRALLSRHPSIYDQFFEDAALGVELREFAQAARELLFALGPRQRHRRSHPDVVQGNPVQAYLRRAQELAALLDKDSAFSAESVDSMAVLDTGDVFDFMTQRSNLLVIDSVVTYCIKSSPVAPTLPPPVAAELLYILRSWTQKASAGRGAAPSAAVLDEWLTSFALAYEADPQSNQTRSLFQQIREGTGIDGIASAALGVSRLSDAIRSGRLRPSPPSFMEELDSEDAKSVYDVVLRLKPLHGRRMPARIDAVLLAATMKVWRNAPDRIRLISSAPSLRIAAQQVMGTENPLRSASEYAYGVRAVESGIPSTTVGTAASQLAAAVRITRFDMADLATMNERHRRSLTKAFDDFAPVYRNLLWPIDEMIIEEERTKRTAASFPSMDEFYQRLAAEGSPLNAFRHWWDQCCEAIFSFRLQVPESFQGEVRALESLLSQENGE